MCLLDLLAVNPGCWHISFCRMLSVFSTCSLLVKWLAMESGTSSCRWAIRVHPQATCTAVSCYSVRCPLEPSITVLWLSLVGYWPLGGQYFCQVSTSGLHTHMISAEGLKLGACLVFWDLVFRSGDQQSGPHDLRSYAERCMFTLSKTWDSVRTGKKKGLWCGPVQRQWGLFVEQE